MEKGSLIIVLNIIKRKFYILYFRETFPKINFHFSFRMFFTLVAEKAHEVIFNYFPSFFREKRKQIFAKIKAKCNFFSRKYEKETFIQSLVWVGRPGPGWVCRRLTRGHGGGGSSKETPAQSPPVQ